MYNLVKADILKLKWSNMYLISIGLIALMLGLYMLNPDVSFIASGDINTVGNSIGFISNINLQSNNYNFNNILRASMSYTIFYWIVILVFSISFFTKEFSQRTIKLFIANGESRFNIYLSKLIVISIFSFILYILLTMTMLFYISFKLDYLLNMNEIILSLKIIILNFLAIEVFILLSIFISIILKNIVISNLTVFMYIFVGIMLYMNVWDNMSNQSFLVKLFLKANPIYYWSTISAYNFNNNIINETITYFFVSSIILIALSYLTINNKELK